MQSAHSELLSEGVLRRYERCPICLTEGRREVQHAFKSNKYIDHLQELDPRLDQEAVRLLPTYECTTCTTHYCDPWLSSAASARFFNSGFAQHGYGWNELYRTIEPGKVDTHEEHRAKLWAYISTGRKVDTYAEVNCPFTGLLPYFRKQELGERRTYATYQQSVKAIQTAGVHPTSSEAYVPFIQRLGARLPKRPQPAAPERVIEAFPRRRYLIRETTSLFWGGNCIARGATCSGVSSGFLKAAPIDFKDVARENIRLDVLGLYNCLDHFFDPMQILRTAVDVSTEVILVCHTYSELSKQHLFCLGPRFEDYLRSRGWAAKDISSDVLMRSQMKNNRALSISRS